MKPTPVASTTIRATRREWIGLAVLALPTLLLSLDLSVLFLALPRLGAELDASGTQQLWIMDIYGFLIAGFLITMGTLGDRIGRRKLLLIGGAAFGLASIAAAYSVNAEMLIGTRALLGIAGATLMPSTLALISNMFRDAKQRGVAIGVWMSCFIGGTAIGPIVGGVLLEHFWWGSAFLLGVPVMALLLILAPLLLPEFRDPAGGKLDLVSVGLSLAAILPVIYGVKEFAKDGVQASSLIAVVIGLAFGAVFAHRQTHLAESCGAPAPGRLGHAGKASHARVSGPLLDLRLFANRTFSAALAIGLVGGATMGGTFLFVSQYLQLVEGFSPLKAGLWLVPSTIAMIAASMIAPVIAHRVRPGYVIASGLVIAALGFVVLTQVDSVGGLPVLIAGMVLACVGIAPPTALGTGLIVGSVPPEKAGSASSMSETSGEFGIAFGLATLGSVGTAVYRNDVEVPAGLSADAATAAHESAAGAVSVSQNLPGSVAAELLATARDAYTSGLTMVATVSAVLMTALAVVAVILFKHVRPTAEPEPGEQREPVVSDETPERLEPVGT